VSGGVAVTTRKTVLRFPFEAQPKNMRRRAEGNRLPLHEHEGGLRRSETDAFAPRLTPCNAPGKNTSCYRGYSLGPDFYTNYQRNYQATPMGYSIRRTCISVRLVGTAVGRSGSHEIAEATCRYWYRVPLATSVALSTHSFPTYHLHIYNTYLHGTCYLHVRSPILYIPSWYRVLACQEPNTYLHGTGYLHVRSPIHTCMVPGTCMSGARLRNVYGPFPAMHNSCGYKAALS